jgi:hypothetical protein
MEQLRNLKHKNQAHLDFESFGDFRMDAMVNVPWEIRASVGIFSQCRNWSNLNGYGEITGFSDESKN